MVCCFNHAPIERRIVKQDLPPRRANIPIADDVRKVAAASVIDAGMAVPHRKIRGTQIAAGERGGRQARIGVGRHRRGRNRDILGTQDVVKQVLVILPCLIFLRVRAEGRQEDICEGIGRRPSQVLRPPSRRCLTFNMVLVQQPGGMTHIQKSGGPVAPPPIVYEQLLVRMRPLQVLMFLEKLISFRGLRDAMQAINLKILDQPLRDCLVSQGDNRIERAAPKGMR